MKIAVLGAGAVGLCVAAKLSKVCDVYAVTRKRHTDIINNTGFVMTGIWGNETVVFPCSESLPAGERYDYIIITSKSTDTRAICEQFKDYLKDTPVVSLQNGIGNEEIISEYTGTVLGGMIITGFEWVKDASVLVSVEAAPIKIGVYPEGVSDASAKLVEIFSKAGMNTLSESNIAGGVWGKALYNAALNPLSAILGIKYGELFDANTWSIIEDIVKEAFAVCEKEGVRLEWKTPEEYLKHLHSHQLPATQEHYSSMYQDLAIRKRTEIDFINGSIVELAKKHGIPAPVNEVIVRLIKFRENQNAAQGATHTAADKKQAR